MSASLLIVLSVALLVRVGQMLLISGSVRSKNASSAGVRLLLDMAIASLGIWAIGGAFVPGVRDAVITWPHLIGIGNSSGHVFRVLPLILIATAAIHGATAERIRSAPLLILAAGMGVFIPFLLQMSGRAGSPDSGVGIAATAGGAAALVSAIFAGARKGKFNRDLSVNFVPGHNIVLQLTGVMLLIVAYMVIAASGDLLSYRFGERTVSTLMCAMSAALVGASFGKLKFGKIDSGLALASCLGGLTAGAVGVGPTWIAVPLGCALGLIVPWSIMTLEIRFRVDDVTGVVATQLISGVLGMIVASSVAFVRDPTAWVLMWFGFVVIAPVVGAAIAAGVCLACKSQKRLRQSEDAEFDGSDLSELDVNAYPDFQQTMIKSYHLREL